MTTYVDFAPSTASAFQFQLTLDGDVYNAIITWNLFAAQARSGTGYYVNLYALDGTLVLCTALVGSPSGFAIATLSWANGKVTVTTVDPHGLKLATIVSLTIAGCTPSAYNGPVQALVTGPSTLTYSLSADPGTATVFGSANQNINLVGGVPDENGDYFTSTLVFRQQSQQFEINP